MIKRSLLLILFCVTSVLFSRDRQGEINPSHETNIGGQRGDPKDKDAFFSIQLKIGFIFGRERR